MKRPLFLAMVAIGSHSTLDALDKQVRDDMRAALLQSGDQKYIDLASMVHDLGDEAAADELIDLDDALIGSHLQEIEAAKWRLADGSTDRCIDCNDDIGYGCLLAYAVSVRCIVCQGQYEKAHKRGATPRSEVGRYRYTTGTLPSTRFRGSGYRSRPDTIAEKTLCPPLRLCNRDSDRLAFG